MNPSPNHDEVLDAVRDFVFEAYPYVPRELVPDDANLPMVLSDYSLFRNKLLSYVRGQIAPAKVPVAKLQKKNFASITAVTELIKTLRASDAGPDTADATGAAARATVDAEPPTTDAHTITGRS